MFAQSPSPAHHLPGKMLRLPPLGSLQAPGRERGQGGPRLPKMPVLQDFQFFDTPRLLQLYEQDHAFELHKHALAQREAAAKAQVRPGTLLVFGGLTCLAQAELLPQVVPRGLIHEAQAHRQVGCAALAGTAHRQQGGLCCWCAGHGACP